MRSLRSAPVREPQPDHRATANLELPEWLPQPIASYARKKSFSCRTKSDELMLRRLTSDPRMKGVWSELLKRKRSNYQRSEAFKYPATSQMEWWSPRVRESLRGAQTIRAKSDQDNEGLAQRIEAITKFARITDIYTWSGNTFSELPIQECALVAFFSQAFEFALSDSRPVSRALALKKRAHYCNMADLIRTDVADLDSYSAKALIDAASFYEGLANNAAPPPGHPLHVQRKRRGDERQTAFLLLLVDASRAIFGQPLYGIVSIVANVVFKCQDWTDARVRKVTKGTRPLPERATIGP